MPKLNVHSILSCGLFALSSIAATTISEAAVIVDTTPNAGTSFRVGGPSSQVETMSWTQTGSYTGVSISALVGSEDGSSESITAYLTSSIGGMATAPIATSTVSVATFATDAAITPASLFSGLSLGAGSYYLTIFNADTTGNVNVRWARGTGTVFGTGNSGNGEYFANSTNGTPNTSNPWQSTFVVSGFYDNGFTVAGTPVSTTPEPATFGLASAFAGVLLAVARRNRV